MSIDALAALAAALTGQAVSEGPHLNAPTLGSCIGRNGPMDLSRVLFLENRVLDLTNRRVSVRVSVERQTVRIEELGQADGSTYVVHMGSLVAEGEDDADIFLKLAFINNRHFVYWRETYQHRMFRQGLFEIVGHNLVPFCQGNGGTSSSH